ncbi:MAG: O-methyltransferase [Pseudomonadales bacterium]
MSIKKDLLEINKKIDGISSLLITPGGPIIHHINKFRGDVISAIERHDYKNYVQIESFIKLVELLGKKFELPSLRGWALSPDVSLMLYKEIIAQKPAVVVEFGSGVSTLIIAAALRKNSFGNLVSIDHSHKYSKITRENLTKNNLQPWVEMRVDELKPWKSSHLYDKSPVWYAEDSLDGVEQIDFVLVDGPPGSVCGFSRYPALPFVFNKLSKNAQIWLDDALRDDECKISEAWCEVYDYQCELHRLDKGLRIFTMK